MAQQQQISHPRAKAVLDYWFGEGWEAAPPSDIRPQQQRIWWSNANPEVDAEIVRLFSGDIAALLAGEHDDWQQQPLESLAGIIIGDQLCRNAFRGTPQMYAADDKVYVWTRQMLDAGQDKDLKPVQRLFAYMPLVHREVLSDQDEIVDRSKQMQQECEAAGWEDAANLFKVAFEYAEAHRAVVAKWGRFPHRNAILGRQSSPEEEAGLADGSIGRW